MARVRVVLLVGAVVAAAVPATAQARAELDRSFSGDGAQRTAVSSDHARSVLVLGGRTFVLGSDGRIVQVSAAGNVVRSYGQQGTVTLPDVRELTTPLTLLADPRAGDPRGIVAVGASGQSGLFTVRLDSHGRRDAGWGTAGISGVLDHDGYVFPAKNALTDPARPGTIVVGAVVMAQPYCVGVIVGCAPRLQLVRLRPDGRPDPSWGSGGSVSVPLPSAGTPAVALANGPDGSVTALLTVVGPYRPGATGVAMASVRVDRGGAVLPGDGGSSVHVLPPSASAVMFADAGRGVFLTGARDGLLSHVNADGTADRGFTDVRLPPRLTPLSARTTPDGVVVTGTERPTKPGKRVTPLLVRYRSGGTLDRSFAPPKGLLRARFGNVRTAQELAALTEDGAGRLVLGGSVGDLYTDIREDLEVTTLGVMRIRIRAPDLDLASARLVVGRGGEASVRVRCRTGVPGGCGIAIVAVRRSARVLGRTRVPRLRAGQSRTVRLRVGAVGRRLATRRATVDVALTPKVVASRPQETAPVLRAGRLAAG
jgi:hypothetical protein